MATGPIVEDEIIQIERNPWADNFFRPATIVIMIMCLNIALVNLTRLVNPAWSGFFFLLGMFVTTVEAIYSHRVLRSYRVVGQSTLRYRLVEAGLLLLLLKLFSLMGKSTAVAGAELRAILDAPTNFMTTEFYVIVCLSALAWLAATFTIADFEALYDPYVDNRTTLSDLANRFYWGGGLLVVISGTTQWIARYGISSLVNFNRPTMGGVILNVLVYFVLGLVLLSQVNLTRLQIRWQLQKLTPPDQMIKPWAKYGGIFLAAIALVAFILPTSYSLGLLDSAAIGLRFTIELLYFTLQLILLIISIPIIWLLSFFGVEPGSIGNGGASPVMPELPPGESIWPAWLEILRSVVFWLVALAAIGYVLKTYLDDHPDLVKQLKNLKPLRLLLGLLAATWALIRSWLKSGVDLLPTELRLFKTKTSTSPTNTLQNWLGLRHLSARERILYYYLNILAQAQKKGPPRHQAQTPYEYEPNLQQSIPTVEQDVHELTDVFVHARYSQEDFDDTHVATAKARWSRIKKALRRDGKL